MNRTSKLYFMYAVDCEPLAAKSPACGGPESWEVSEQAITQYAEIFRARDLMGVLNFHTTPEAAKVHRGLLLALHREGCDLGLQLNVPGFRFPKYQYDLGFYDRDEQKQILEEATQDFTDTLGFASETYVACCGSKNKHTVPLLVSLGYRQARTPLPGRYFPDRPDRCTVGCFPYPHWASAEHPLLSGNLPLCIIPGTGERTGIRGTRPFDLRPESPSTAETRERYRRIIDEHLEVQALIDPPVKAIVAGAHNTEFVHFENVAFVVDYVREAAERKGLELIPANGPTVREALECSLERV